MSMTVGTLIEKLKKFPLEKPVYILSPDDNPLSAGLDIENIFEVSGSENDADNAVYLMEG